MSAAAVLLALHEAGIKVDAVEGQIRCRHAPGALTPALAARVREEREAILALLADSDAFVLAMALEIFVGELIEEGEASVQVAEEPSKRRCYACGYERGSGVAVCPVCHPPASLCRNNPMGSCCGAVAGCRQIAAAQDAM